MNKVIAYPVVRALIYDRDGMIRSVDHYQGGGPAPIYAADGIQPGKQPALWLPFDWGQLRPVSEPALELTEKPYLKDPTRPDEENLDSIFLLRDEMTVLSGDGKLSDANGWWTAWFGRGDRLLTRLRPKAFTLPGYEPPDDALSDSPPVEIDASDMNYWIETVMAGYPDLYEPLKLTYSPPLGNRVRNDPDNDRRAQVWLQPDYEPQRAPYTLIGQAYDFPLVTGVLHTAYADICPFTQDAEGNDTCLPHPYFSPNAPQAGLPPEERTTPVYTFSAPESPDEEVWLELSATWWDKRTKEEQGAQSGNAGGVEIAHPKGILTSLTPDGASHLEQRLHWRLVTPPNRPDLLETLPATIASEPFTRLVPHARLNIREPGMYDVELSVVGDEGDRLMLDTMQVQVMGVDLDAHWPGTMAEPGAPVSDADENDPLNLFMAVNNDDDNGDRIADFTPSTLFPQDDELITIVVRKFGAPELGTGTLELSAAEPLRFFTADGSQELTLPLTLDLAEPSGPLAAVGNPSNPQDVTLLIEAQDCSRDAVITLRYLEDGQEVVRNDVHLTIVNTEIVGSFTRGSIEYANTIWLADQGVYLAFGSLTDDKPLSLLISLPEEDIPDEAVATAGVRYGLGTAPTSVASRVSDPDYVSNLVFTYNLINRALTALFGWPLKEYTEEQIRTWLFEESGIAEEKLMNGRYFATAPTDVTIPVQYTVQFLQQGQHVSTKSVFVRKTVDLDIDSDNNNGYDADWMSTPEEEKLEGCDDCAGKIVYANHSDDDEDEIPDFADGFNRDNTLNTDDDINAHEYFVPVILELPAIQEWVDLADVQLRFTYDASAPGDIREEAPTGNLPFQRPARANDVNILLPAADGHLRLWRKDGNEARTEADYVLPSPHVYTASDLGFTNDQRKITLHLEGVTRSEQRGDQEIMVEMNVDNDARMQFDISDSVRTTVLGVELVDLRNGGRPVRANSASDAFIQDDAQNIPQMPQLVARLLPEGLMEFVHWQLTIEDRTQKRYDWNNDGDTDLHEFRRVRDDWYELPEVLDDIDAAWEMWRAYQGEYRGKKATLFWQLHRYEDQPEHQQQFVFHIRGRNPDWRAVENYIAQLFAEWNIDEPWYVRPLARMESGRNRQRYPAPDNIDIPYAQFNDNRSSLGPDKYYANINGLNINMKNYRFCPNFGGPNGWGIMMLDNPPATVRDLWYWPDNIQRGVDHLINTCRDASLEDGGAAAWINEQIQQQQRQNPDMSLNNQPFPYENCIFQSGTAHTPIDACTIQRYNGTGAFPANGEFQATPGGWTIFWDNDANGGVGAWGQNYNAHIIRVCREWFDPPQ